MPIRPIKNQVLVRQDALKERLASGLYLPETASRELQEDFATVLAVGSDPALVVAPGDRVLFRRRPGTALVYDRRDVDQSPEEWKDLLMLVESDILGIVDPD